MINTCDFRFFIFVTENSCRVDRTEEGCAKRVICNFNDEVVRDKREFIISLRADASDGKHLIFWRNLSKTLKSCYKAAYTCSRTHMYIKKIEKKYLTLSI